MTTPDSQVPRHAAARDRGPSPQPTTISSDSPALLGRRAGEAREIKFRVPLDRLDALSAALAARLARDPHGEPHLDGDYRVASLYFDTPDLEVYRRVGWHRFRKFRVRRYGGADAVFLERKTRLGDLVRKDRTPVALDELPRLAESDDDQTWIAADFRRQLARRSLAPVAFIQYRRRAFYGALDGGPSGGALRVTIDRDARGASTDGWSFGPRSAPVALLVDTTPFPTSGSARGTGAREFMLVEIKFTSGRTDHQTTAAIPGAIKRLIAELGLGERGISKYRRCMRLLGPDASPTASAPEVDDDA